MLACAGHTVRGFDVDERLITDLRLGLVSTQEAPVRDLVTQAIRRGTFRAGTSVEPSDVFIICVPTPALHGRPDLRCVIDALRRVVAVVRPGDAIVLESTVPPGTTERLVTEELRAAGIIPDAVRVAHCPERVIPGAIVEELRGNARVIGGRRPSDAAFVAGLYASFCRGEILQTDCMTAELTKCVENTYRDVNIAFANELAMLAEDLGVDVYETIALANRHPRVDILMPGPGVGGHCIPVDPHFLTDANPFVTELIQSARRVNERMPHRIVSRICARLPHATAGSKIAVLGAAYKADVDDARESPTERIVELLEQRGFTASIYDPLVRSFRFPLTATLEEALRGADAVVLATGHAVFRAIEPHRAAKLMRGTLLFDARNALDAELWEAAGFEVAVLGRPSRDRVARAMTA
jgi:UDP-N-acetyl-D-mannosaminuronic acid dehydrogenase